MQKNRTTSKPSAGSGTVSGTTRIRTARRRSASKTGQYRTGSSDGRRASRGSKQRSIETLNLEVITQEITQLEMQLNEEVQNMQTELSNSTNYMLDSISMWSNVLVEGIRSSRDEAQALQDTNEKTNAQWSRMSQL